MDNKRQIGEKKEQLAVEFLRKKGYFIIETNFRVRQAEIDIVARDGSTIVFVEVKYRATDKLGHPFDAVDYKKQQKISRAALFYMSKNKLSIDNTSVRFDVIGILGEEIFHLKDAFYFRGDF